MFVDTVTDSSRPTDTYSSPDQSHQSNHQDCDSQDHQTTSLRHCFLHLPPLRKLARVARCKVQLCSYRRKCCSSCRPHAYQNLSMSSRAPRPQSLLLGSLARRTWHGSSHRTPCDCERRASCSCCRCRRSSALAPTARASACSLATSAYATALRASAAAVSSMSRVRSQTARRRLSSGVVPRETPARFVLTFLLGVRLHPSGERFMRVQGDSSRSGLDRAASGQDASTRERVSPGGPIENLHPVKFITEVYLFQSFGR